MIVIDDDFDIDGNPAPYNPISMSGFGNHYDDYMLKPQSYLDINLILDGGFEVADYTSFEEALEEEAYHRTCFAFAFEEAVAVVVVAVVACILLLASYAVVGGIAVAARLLP